MEDVFRRLKERKNALELEINTITASRDAELSKARDSAEAATALTTRVTELNAKIEELTQFGVSLLDEISESVNGALVIIKDAIYTHSQITEISARAGEHIISELSNMTKQQEEIVRRADEIHREEMRLATRQSDLDILLERIKSKYVELGLPFYSE